MCVFGKWTVDAPALNDVVAGHVPMRFDALLSFMPFVKAGRLRAIVVTGAQPASAPPGVPTLDAAGP
ncbi:tripartite tricarboxylate transporter substrate-binding protein [Achromobacter sp. UMC46]|uniref:tripartite tricarboxylate transporter substrate-binding protein n=1 Tax=Achromobacter sp. UMC46 TaxID=1862319 RepID=UPI00351C69EF